jgi:hypothetical protein
MTQSPNGLSAKIIVSSGKVWQWQLELIQALKSKRLINVYEVVSNDSATLSSVKSIKLLHKCDAALFRSPLNAFDIVAADLLLSDSIDSKVETTESDILINLSELAIDNKLLGSTKYGVLETRFSESGVLASQSLAISEYLKQFTQVYFAISVTNSDGKTRVLSELRPSLDKGSLSRNLVQYFQLIGVAWERAMHRLTEDESLHDIPQSFSSSAFEGKPSLPIMSIPKLYQRFGCHVADKLLQKYKQNEQWVLLLQFRSEQNNAEAPLSFSDYAELIPPKDVFWADPFVVSKEGQHFVFFEELPFETERGHLSCMEVFKDGSYSEPKTILKQPYHLSFPNVFEHDSTYYMIPETGDNGAIELYHCTDFPYQWERSHTLIENLHAYDSTLLERDGEWWLFANVAAEKGMSGNEELHIFYADSPLSTEWKAHKANPVISDASKARPAGQFFKVGEDWFRPSQDCAGHYGAGLNINKIITLDEDKYIEQLVQTCRPDWKDDLTALHTLNFNNDVAVADALRVTSKGVF